MPYNIACGDRTSNNQILNYLKEKFGEKVKIKHAPERKGDVKHTQADISLAMTSFSYKPIVRFWEGLDRTIEWWGLKPVEDNK